ncbi:hypothetical protein Hamer_G013187 [Homarus americanus]|uniref:Uncharacterized protein n=1 Tax=Homarus americanus TaxID=6706 RepID=A0A8J5JWP0_HOMAM|nr:hypothetical protein Hamer_G030867 [Homarus americanus]KAG7165675.1 hypothetical protein Hamer_G013187 [Homarus americanus]
MNIKHVLGAPFIITRRNITRRRDFPGQRFFGATNYGTHSFGKNGYDGRPLARRNKFPSRRRTRYPHHHNRVSSWYNRRGYRKWYVG